MSHSTDFYTVRGYQLLDQDKSLLTPALEDYLEMIYRMSLLEDPIRMSYLARSLNVKTSSASKMVQNLSLLNLVSYKKYGVISLTPEGIEVGSYLYKRHYIIEAFLKNLDLSHDICTETELLEHNISPHTLSNIDLFNQYLTQHPLIKEDFKKFKQTQKEPKKNPE